MHGRWAYQHCVVSLRTKEEIKMRKVGRGGGGGTMDLLDSLIGKYDKSDRERKCPGSATLVHFRTLPILRLSSFLNSLRTM